ncbi:hypothetical protein N7462_006763 [Penicillium macrosclerotiorum]|uniref:uncharacterized protein n=1 Tax=Penicillium macrosclerotiorum TaxID=303699 RepID=UPI0025471172|nr:uncharacterized protein N7462_006763 [Penicillium macrosclerotiorum]KAJ5683598.1 hypothetical protein N7462_006763 [Penicillium macrosclerotiorum]
MSATTTSTTTRSLSVLADYEVYHSGSEENATASAPINSTQPADWPAHHRRMPAYRAANHHLDLTDRPAGNGHPAEYAFIQIMLHGVWLNASVARLWRFTGGRLNDKIFHYEVGGEW